MSQTPSAHTLHKHKQFTMILAGRKFLQLKIQARIFFFNFTFINGHETLIFPVVCLYSFPFDRFISILLGFPRLVRSKNVWKNSKIHHRNFALTYSPSSRNYLPPERTERNIRPDQSLLPVCLYKLYSMINNMYDVLHIDEHAMYTSYRWALCMLYTDKHYVCCKYQLVMLLISSQTKKLNETFVWHKNEPTFLLP